MTKQMIIKWIKENQDEIGISYSLEPFDRVCCNSFFNKIEELSLKDSEENLIKKIAKLIFIYAQIKELENNKKYQDALFYLKSEVLNTIKNEIENSSYSLNTEKLKNFLYKNYNIKYLELFLNNLKDTIEVYSVLFNEEDKIKIIEYMMEKEEYKFLKILKRRKLIPDNLPKHYNIAINIITEDVKEFSTSKHNIKQLYSVYKNEILTNGLVQLIFIKKYYKMSKKNLKEFLENEKIDLFKESMYYLIQQDENFIECFPKEKILNDKKLIHLYREIKKIQDPLVLAKKVKEILSNKIYGQKYAIEKITDAVKNKLIFDEKSPRYVFTFLGPSATGKTYTAQLLQEVFEGYAFKQFDMSLYERSDSGISLIGSDFKFSDSAPGELTEFVLKNPKSIIVFDEIEKCHPQIQKQLLTILSEGYLEDKHGWCKEIDKSDKSINYIPFKTSDKEEDTNCKKDERITKVSFKDTIIIFTSNAGENLYSDNKFWEIVKDDSTLAESMIIDELKKEKRIYDGHEFPATDPALLSRISSGEIILFEELDFESIYKIANDMFLKYNDELIIKVGVEFKSKDLETFLKIFLLKYFPILDVRRIKNKIANDIYDYISDEMMKRNYTFDDFKAIELKVSRKAKSKFNNILKENPKIKEYFFRKNLTAEIDIDYKFEKDKIIFIIKDFELKKFKNIRDIKEDLLFDIPEVKFKDIIGHKLVKEKLKQIVAFLKNAKKLKEYNVKMPKGMLLYGPPGTGKTLLAKALAAEADLPFFATTGSDIKNYYTNEKGERKLLMDRIFNKAKKYAPSIVFIDEIDALGNRTQNHYEADIINKFLTLLSGFEDEENFVFVIAATNYKERIDPAILRSGRIDIQIEISILDKEAREFFIKRIIKKLKADEKDFNIEKLTVMSFGMSGADFEKLTTEAGIYLIVNQKQLTEIF